MDAAPKSRSPGTSPRAPHPSSSRFHLRADPEVDPDLLSLACVRMPEIAALPPAGERMPVKALIEAQRWTRREPLIVVTARDLDAPGCASVFGYADPRRRVAVVSTFRLRSRDRALTRRRIAKVLAHERLHLDGRGHCRTPECVLHPAGNLEELDRRGMEPCHRCRRPRRRWLAGAALVALCLLFSFGVDAALTALSRKAVPFSWRSEAGSAALTWKGTTVLRLHSPEQARHAARSLNRLFADIDPPHLEVHGDSSRARVESSGQLLFEIDPTLAASGSAAAFARAWVAAIDPLIQGKGSPSEGCPDCHMFRRSEVREAAVQRAKWWR